MNNYKYFLVLAISLNVIPIFIYFYYSEEVPQPKYTLPSNSETIPSVPDDKDFFYDVNIHPPQLTETTHEACTDCIYKFRIPLIALRILNQLDVYEPIPIKAFNSDFTVESVYNKTLYGIKKDSNYCKKHREYFVKNTDTFFTRKVVWASYDENHILNKYLPEIVENVNQFKSKVTDGNKPMRPLSFENSLFLSQFDVTDAFRQNMEYSCLSQYSNHLIGTGTITRKDLVAVTMNKYIANYTNRKECDDFSLYFPRSWHLQDKEDCQNFFEKNFNTEEYQELKKEQIIVFIRKEGSGFHVGKGVQPVDDDEEASLRTLYKNGSHCGYLKKNYVIQKYIHNSLLLLGHKFDFRSYLLIASTNPMIAYYADGFLRLSLFEYDPRSDKKEVLLTNAASVNYVFEEAKKGNYIANMTEEELKEFQYWNYTRLANHLIQIGKIKSMDWLEHFRFQMKKVMVHLVRIAHEKIVSRSSFFELFGIDFILDENMNLFFLECNAGPMMMGKIDKKREFFQELNKDMIDLMYAYLRSRLKRIVYYVNKLSDQLRVEHLDQIPEKKLSESLDEFKQISKNYLEPEFAVTPSRFFKIVDFNLPEDQRFYSVRKECF